MHGSLNQYLLRVIIFIFFVFVVAVLLYPVLQSAFLSNIYINLIIILSLIGVAALYSAADGNFHPWAINHIIRFSIFLIILILISLIDIKIIFKYSYLFFFISLLLLFSVEIIGTFGKGAERWIKIFGVSIQPSEIVKVGLILGLAKYYHSIKFENIRR